MLSCKGLKTRGRGYTLLIFTKEKFSKKTHYHVTERTYAPAIQSQGFLGGCGDIGFGVYFYGTFESAQDYAARGAWDGELVDPVILEISDEEITKIEPWDLYSTWDQATYEDKSWFYQLCGKCPIHSLIEAWLGVKAALARVSVPLSVGLIAAQYIAG